MNGMNFSILSLNVRGLRDYKKNKKLFNWIVKHNGDKGISFLQETHSTAQVENEWHKRTRGELIMSHGTSKSKGTAILFGSKLNYRIKEKILDKDGRYVIIVAEIQGNNFVLINSYLPNLEDGQVSVMKEIVGKKNSLEMPVDITTIWGGDFNFIFDTELEASGGNPKLKTKSFQTIQTIMQELDLCDIWRLRNPLTKRYTWRGKGQGIRSNHQQYIHRRLDFFLISDELQSYIKECDIIPAPSTDHSAIILNIDYFKEGNRGPSFWKLNNSLLNSEDYLIGLKTHLKTIRQSLNKEGVRNYQLRWEFIKYEIRKFSMKYSKAQALKRRSKYEQIEKEIVSIESESNWENNKQRVAYYDKLKIQLENLSNYITEGLIVRSRALWYELGEKNK